LEFGTGVFCHDGVACFGEERVFLALATLLTALIKFNFPYGLVAGGTEVPPYGERIGPPPATAIRLADSGGNGQWITGVNRVHRRHAGRGRFG